MFNQFIEKNTHGYSYTIYSGAGKRVENWYNISGLDCFSSSFISDYFSLWCDFVGFRFDLFSNKLSSLLYKKLNCSKKDIEYFYNHFKYHRNHFAILPTQITSAPFGYIPKEARFDLYQEIVNYFVNSNNSIGIKKMNNINPILVYYYIWNCIYLIMHKQYYNDNGYVKYGFDYKIGNNIFLFDSNKICQLLQEYIIDQLTQTNVFGNYCVKAPYDETEESKRKRKEEGIKSKNKCKKDLFNNDFSEFNKLLEYSICDLVKASDHINDYKKLISGDDKYDSGISNIIVNRLCYVIFNDLSMYSLNLSNEIKFPKLIKFYKFLFNFSIYLHCYPFNTPNLSKHQEYYLVQYFNYKDNIFENIAQLKQFNYLDNNWHGTLLHGATDASFRQMCKVLIKDGFDCKKFNRSGPKKITPYSIAQNRNDLFMVGLFEQEVLFFVNPCTFVCVCLVFVMLHSLQVLFVCFVVL